MEARTRQIAVFGDGRWDDSPKCQPFSWLDDQAGQGVRGELHIVHTALVQGRGPRSLDNAGLVGAPRFAKRAVLSMRPGCCVPTMVSFEVIECESGRVARRAPGSGRCHTQRRRPFLCLPFVLHRIHGSSRLASSGLARMQVIPRIGPSLGARSAGVFGAGAERH